VAALEANHAVRRAIDEAIRRRQEGVSRAHLQGSAFCRGSIQSKSIPPTSGNCHAKRVMIGTAP